MERAEDEMKDLRAARTTLQEDVGELERLEDTFRIRLKTAQEQRSKIPALVRSATHELHEELAELQKCIKQQNKETQNIRESASQREQQLLHDWSTGEAQLQSALQDLQQRTQELNQAQRNMQLLRKQRHTLEEKKSLIEETVMRECEEREELNSALTLAREQLLELKQSTTKACNTQTHTPLSRSTAMCPDLSNPKLSTHTCNRGSLSTQGSRHKCLAE
ncbi:E3 ubiquitin-protein ligase TRAIP-like isoform X2 [Xyrauchen texanus]|nr:E3 ubiquitin-protein ligase TRAIP-like isoform X2 [Xyrauchen texanus]